MFTLKDLRNMFYALFAYHVDDKITKTILLHSIYKKITGVNFELYRSTLTKKHLLFIADKLYLDLPDESIYKLESAIYDKIVNYTQPRVDTELSLVSSSARKSRSKSRSKSPSKNNRKRIRIRVKRKNHRAGAHRHRRA